MTTGLFLGVAFLFIFCVSEFLLTKDDLRKYWLYSYLGVSVFDSLILFFFFFKYNCLTNTKLFEGNDIFKDKNYNRFQLYCFHVTYTIFAVIQNCYHLFVKIGEKMCDRLKPDSYQKIEHN